MAQRIYYDDGAVIHSCEAAEVHPGIRLVWTHCERDVPANQGFTVKGEQPAVTCQKCAEG